MTEARSVPGARRQPGEVWGAAMGLVAILCGAAGGAIEGMLSRPWPGAADPTYADFLVENRTLIVAQSVLFVLNSAALIWFLGYVRAELLRAERPPGTVSGIAFGAGLVAFGMLITGQAAQVTLTLASQSTISPAIAAAVEDLCLATLTLANIPVAVMFAAIAVVSLARRAFPAWLGWLAVLSAVACLLSGLAVIPAEGPLSPMGWLTSVLRLVPLFFYLPAAIIMMLPRRESR